MIWGQPWHFAAGSVFGFVTLGPMMWWAMKNGTVGSRDRPASVYYENNCTKEEIERFQQQDLIESMAWHMRGTPGYGFVQSDPRFQ